MPGRSSVERDDSVEPAGSSVRSVSVLSHECVNRPIESWRGCVVLLNTRQSSPFRTESAVAFLPWRLWPDITPWPPFTSCVLGIPFRHSSTGVAPIGVPIVGDGGAAIKNQDRQIPHFFRRSAARPAPHTPAETSRHTGEAAIFSRSSMLQQSWYSAGAVTGSLASTVNYTWGSRTLFAHARRLRFHFNG